MNNPTETVRNILPAWDGATIRARETSTPTEHLVMNQSKQVTLVGGHDCDLFRIRGFTSIWQLTIEKGMLAVENLVIE